MVTGSSAFSLRGQIGEPLTGRAIFLQIFPLAQIELKSQENYLETKENLELLEKTYVLFPLFGFSRNLRKEYTKTPRYFYWDLGIRNSIIANYNRLNMRDDVGRLWENYCLVERIKKLSYRQISANRFFWRTYDQKEIDYLEEREGKLFGFEFKFRADKIKVPKEFLTTYPNSKLQLINLQNYLDFIS